MLKNKPKAALFNTDFIPYSQTFVYEELIHHEKYEMEVFSHIRKNPERFPFEKLNYLYPADSITGLLEAALYGITTCSPRYMKKIKNGGFSLIHAQFGPGSIYALPYALKSKLPFIVTFCGYDVPLLMTPRRFWPKYWRYWWLSRLLFKRVDRCLAVSQDLANKLVELGVEPDKVKVFHRGVHVPKDLPAVDKTNKDRTDILMVGRFVEKKGFEYGIQAVGKLLQKGLPIKLHIAGDGELKSKYLKIIKEFSISDKVVFHGQLPQKTVFDLMHTSDIALVPSVVAANGDTEGVVNVIKEANARALPAVITRHGGNPDIVEDDKTGLIVPEKDVEAMASALEKLVLDPTKRINMGLAAREKMKNELSFELRIQALEKHYDETVKNCQR